LGHYGTLDAETLKGGYLGLIKSVKDILAASPVAAMLLKRTVRFLDRVLETGNVRYTPAAAPASPTFSLNFAHLLNIQ
jgi:hypothetical protein